MKKYFVFSDPHGEFAALHYNLIGEGFDEENENHILFSLGDLFDRGPQSDMIAKYCIDMWQKGRFIGLLGNHDEMLLDFLLGKKSFFHIYHNGLDKTLNQLAKTHFGKYRLDILQTVLIEKINSNYPLLMDFLKSLDQEKTFGKYHFTHGGMTKAASLDAWYVNNWAMTPQFIFSYNKTPDIIEVFGHWQAKNLNKMFCGYREILQSQVFIYQNFIGIDNISNLTKNVNVLTLEQIQGKWNLKIPTQLYHPDFLNDMFGKAF